MVEDKEKNLEMIIAEMINITMTNQIGDKNLLSKITKCKILANKKLLLVVGVRRHQQEENKAKMTTGIMIMIGILTYKISTKLEIHQLGQMKEEIEEEEEGNVTNVSKRVTWQEIVQMTTRKGEEDNQVTGLVLNANKKVIWQRIVLQIPNLEDVEEVEVEDLREVQENVTSVIKKVIWLESVQIKMKS